MLTDIGEYVVGAYLKLEEGCDVIDYNVRPPGGGLKGLGELDVIGLNFKTETAILCEVTTHVTGLLIGSNAKTVEKITAKHERQRAYAAEYLDNFTHHRFMFWSPVVPRGYLTEHLSKIDGLELIINGVYKEKVEQLRLRARAEAQDTSNPFFRSLQILEHLRD